MSSSEELLSDSGESVSSANLSEAEDDIIAELFDSDREDEDFGGFAFELPRNVEWKAERFDVTATDIQLEAGQLEIFQIQEEPLTFLRYFLTMY